MSNQISKLLTHVVGVFDANPLVNTIVFKDDDVVDVEKENVYPLVSMQLLNSVIEYDEPTMTAFKNTRMRFEVYNQRDDIKQATPSKLMSDTNYIDNIGICDTISNDFVMEVLKTHNDLDINIVEVSEFETVRKDERNCLDGIRFEVLFSMHQNAV